MQNIYTVRELEQKLIEAELNNYSKQDELLTEIISYKNKVLEHELELEKLRSYNKELEQKFRNSEVMLGFTLQDNDTARKLIKELDKKNAELEQKLKDTENELDSLYYYNAMSKEV